MKAGIRFPAGTLKKKRTLCAFCRRGKGESVSERSSMENRRAVGMLNPLRDKDEGFAVPGICSRLQDARDWKSFKIGWYRQICFFG